MGGAIPTRRTKRARRPNAAARNTILVAQEKSGNRYFQASTQAELHASALKLVEERSDFGYYEGPDAQVLEILKIVERRDGAAAWAFLRSRTCHDYEHVHLETLE